MANVIDYLIAHGDDDFSTRPINDVDLAILSEVSYLPLDEIVSDQYLRNLGKSFADIHAEFKLPWRQWLNNPYLVMPTRIRLLKHLARAKRFKHLKASYFVNQPLDKGQFGAMTFHEDNHVIVIFRGTDDTIQNWHESISLLYKSEIPSQREAVDYLNRLEMSQPQTVYVAGHSKGGNLAAYAVAQCHEQVYATIHSGYMFDGPELPKSVYQAPEQHQRLKTKIYRYTPQDSLFSYHTQPVKETFFIDANDEALSKHLIPAWYVRETNFVTMPHNSPNGAAIAKAFHRWYNQINTHRLHEVVDVFVDLLTELHIDSVKQIMKHPLYHGVRIYQQYQRLSQSFKKLIRHNLSEINLFYNEAYAKDPYHQQEQKESLLQQIFTFFAS